jgi:hypothetical protein
MTTTHFRVICTLMAVCWLLSFTPGLAAGERNLARAYERMVKRMASPSSMVADRGVGVVGHVLNRGWNDEWARVVFERDVTRKEER